MQVNHSKLKEEFCKVLQNHPLLGNDFAAFLHSAVEFPLKFPDMLEAEHRKLKDRFAAVRSQPFAAK